MRWELSGEQQLFQEALRGWLGRQAASDAVRRWQDTGDPAPYVGTPEDLGG
jgi:hypothetical protein